MLPVIEFALNNAVHASTGFTPFYVNSLTHPHVPLTLPLCGSGLDGDSLLTSLPISPTMMQKHTRGFLATRFRVLRHVRDAIADSQDKQKEQANAEGRGCINSYEVLAAIQLLPIPNSRQLLISSFLVRPLR